MSAAPNIAGSQTPPATKPEGSGRGGSVRRQYAIDDLLDRATFASRSARLTRMLAFGATLLAGGVLAAILLDATASLSAAARIGIDIAILLAVVVGLAWMVSTVRRSSADPRHLAQLLEARGGVPNNQLLNALEFERDRHFTQRGTAAVSAELVGKTIEAGERLAPTMVASAVVDRRALRRALLWTPVVPIVALFLHFAVPNLFAMTLVRFADPFGFHPAFTSLAFDVTVAPDRVKHGRPAMIAVAISGPVRAEIAEVVFVDANDPNREIDVVPMVPEPAAETSDEPASAWSERFALRLERATESLAFVIRTPHGGSSLHRLDVLPVPSFERASATVRPPAYTEWPAQDRSFGGGDLTALRTSDMLVRATATLPLSEGRLSLTSADGATTSVILKPSSADPKTVEGEMPLLTSGKLDLHLIGADGTESDEERSVTLLVTDDGPPTIRVLEPEEQCFVVEGWAIDVMFEAEDDVGVRTIECVRGANGFPPTTVTLEPAGGDARRRLARAHFDTKELGASAGDVIRCFGVAWDSHPDPPHSARSNVITIEVLSEQEYAEMSRSDETFEELTAEAAELDAAMRAMADERDALLKELDRLEQAEAKADAANDASAQAANEEARKELAKRMESFAERAKELAERMKKRGEQPSIYDAEKPWQEALKQQAQALVQQEENANELAQVSRNPGAAAKKRRERAGEEFRKNGEPFGQQQMAEAAQMQQDLEKLAAAEQLLERTEAVRQAILDQRELADQMAQFRQKSNLTPQEALQLQDLAEEQEAIEKQLDQARQELEQAASETAEKLPKMSAQANDIVKKIDESKAQRDQQKACKAGRESNGREAHEAAENAARKLDAMLSECCSNAQQQPMENDLDGCLKMPKPGMKQAMQQMAGARLGSMSSMGARGKSGSGFSGMSARASIVGPHRPNGRPNRESKKVGDHAESKSAQDGDLANYRSGEAERITAGQTRTTAGSGSLLGVPAAYRDDAAAYFRRIAEDAQHSRSETDAPKEGSKP